MATILDLPGISATILVDDEPVREYHATNMSLDDREASLKKAVLSAVPGVNPDSVVLSDVKFTVRYIEAISGKNFALRFDKLAGFYRNAHHLGVKWQVDGYETNIRHEPMDELNSETHWTATSSRVGTGDARRGWSWQYFKFGDLKRIDSEDISKAEADELAQIAQDFGVIRILVYQMNHTSRFSDQDIFNAPGAMDEIHEKALKGRAVTHTVQFDVERNASAPPPRKVDCFRHPQKLPLAIFEFRYMSREGLMQELIIPRSSISDLDASPALQAVPTPRVIRNHQAIPSRDDMSLEETRLFCPEPAQSGINRSSQHIPLSLRRQQARLHSPPRPNPFRQTPFDSPARRQSPSYYRESLRQDGKVVIDLDSDSDDEMFVPRTNFGHVGRPLHQRPSPTFTTGTPAHQIPDRRARCETVDDEEDPFQRSSTTSAPVRTKEVGSRRKTRGPFLADSEDESDVTIQ